MKRLAAALIAPALALAYASTADAALKPGAKAPDFSAPAYLAGKPFTFKLSEALKKGPVVVYFFPSAYTKGCDIEAAKFSEASDQFKALGATVIGVTAGKTDQLAKYSSDAKTCGGKFAVAADDGVKIAKLYDAQLDLPAVKLSNRTSYVIAPDGKVLHAYSAMGPVEHIDETLTAVKAWRSKAGK